MSAPIRTLMFASANDPVRSLKAISIGASAVCLDLEDAVATSEKAAARSVVAQTLLDPSVEGANAHVRINGVDTEFCDDDLTALGPLLPRLSGILVPMVESADQVRHVATRLDAQWIGGREHFHDLRGERGQGVGTRQAVVHQRAAHRLA